MGTIRDDLTTWVSTIDGSSVDTLDTSTLGWVVDDVYTNKDTVIREYLDVEVDELDNVSVVQPTLVYSINGTNTSWEGDPSKSLFENVQDYIETAYGLIGETDGEW